MARKVFHPPLVLVSCIEERPPLQPSISPNCTVARASISLTAAMAALTLRKSYIGFLGSFQMQCRRDAICESELHPTDMSEQGLSVKVRSVSAVWKYYVRIVLDRPTEITSRPGPSHTKIGE